MELDPVIIPLGYSCCVAYNLQRLNLRKQAFPFDWCVTLKINSVIKISKAARMS